jgi:hypothetical protein
MVTTSLDQNLSEIVATSGVSRPSASEARLAERACSFVAVGCSEP